MQINNPLKKGLVIGMLVLFVGTSVIPLAGSNVVVENVNNENRTLMIEYYALYIPVDGCGNVTKNPDQSSYPVGDNVELTAIPDEG